MESGELGELALEGFDTDGRVRGELLGGQGGGGKESGSGAWGAELSRGTFVCQSELPFPLRSSRWVDVPCGTRED